MNTRFTLDCTSEEWKAGRLSGLVNSTEKCPYEKDTQHRYNWVDGWITGHSERDMEEE